MTVEYTEIYRVIQRYTEIIERYTENIQRLSDHVFLHTFTKRYN